MIRLKALAVEPRAGSRDLGGDLVVERSSCCTLSRSENELSHDAGIRRGGQHYVVECRPIQERHQGFAHRARAKRAKDTIASATLGKTYRRTRLRSDRFQHIAKSLVVRVDSQYAIRIVDEWSGRHRRDRRRFCRIRWL